ncbi:calcium-independent protein kinase C [Stagonosporopsis vannaccii]|nr:calcium-independent protein kinase C [Stagonosporopsis vannaccii]
MDGTSTTLDIDRKIDRDKAIKVAADHMQHATSNDSVMSQVESQIRDARRNLEYFQQTLQELETRRKDRGLNVLAKDGNEAQYPPSEGNKASFGPDSYTEKDPVESADHAYPGPASQTFSGAPRTLPYSTSYAAPGSRIRSARSYSNYSGLDLIRYDTTPLGTRIQLMLSRLVFKLSLERQYKDGVEKMIKLYQIEEDRNSKPEAEVQYEDLHVGVQDGTDTTDHDRIDILGQRRPLTGHIFIKIHAVAEVEHAVPGHTAREPERFVHIKVEHSAKGKTKATKTDCWTDEQHGFDVDKANEIELQCTKKAAAAIPSWLA